MSQTTFVAMDNGAEIFIRRGDSDGHLYRVPGFWPVPDAVILRGATADEIAWVERELDLADEQSARAEAAWEQLHCASDGDV